MGKVNNSPSLEQLNIRNGDLVTVEMDSGEKRETEARSDSELLGGHTWVIWLKGISGCYDLERVTPRGEPVGFRPVTNPSMDDRWNKFNESASRPESSAGE